jgi:hypothetical protein
MAFTSSWPVMSLMTSSAVSGSLEHVVVESLVARLAVRIDPGDQEHRVSLVDQPAHHRVRRLHVEHVVLVQPRRDDQQRPARDLGGGRRVLDQLHQLVLVDHLARRDREVAAYLEGAHVGHADLQAAVLRSRSDQKLRTPSTRLLALAALGGRDDLRVAEREVAGRHRVEELAGEEAQLARRVLVQAGRAVGQRQRGLGGRLPGAAHGVEHRALLPGRAAEAPVAARWRAPLPFTGLPTAWRSSSPLMPR